MPENCVHSGPLAVTAETFEGDGDREYAWVMVGDVKVTAYESLTEPGRVVVDIETSDDQHFDNLGVTINDHYVHGGPVTVTTEEKDGPLVEELRAADPKEFGRPAVPSVYADYKALAEAAPNGRVYNVDVKAYLTDRHEIPADLDRHLDHEIYLASGQYRLARMVAEEQAAREEGWVAITEIEPTNGLMLEGRTLPSPLYRLKPTGQRGAPWALLPKGKRTHGLNFTRMGGTAPVLPRRQGARATRHGRPRRLHGPHHSEGELIMAMRMVGAPSPEQMEAAAQVLREHVSGPSQEYILAARIFDAIGAPTEDARSADLDAIITRADKLLDDLALTHERLGPLGMAALRVGISATLDVLTDTRPVERS